VFVQKTKEMIECVGCGLKEAGAASPNGRGDKKKGKKEKVA
jgi:hypothetical protein